MEERDKCIAKSGPIPRLYNLPVKLSALFGKKLHKNGVFDLIERKDVNVMKSWLNEMNENMPENALIIESSTGHSLPYPALLYGRGAWAAVDALFFMPFIPISFIGEQDGYAYRSKISNLYDFDDDERPSVIPSAISTGNLVEYAQAVIQTSIPRSASTTSFSVIPNIKELEEKEENFQKELGPEYGFDIKKIKLHYQHRRHLRNEREVLRTGELVQLVMKHDHGWHRQVLAFARCLTSEIAAIFINLNEHTVSGYADLAGIKKFLNAEGMCVYTKDDWFVQNSEKYYFKEEILDDRHYFSILPYRSLIIGIYPSNVSSKEALTHSIERLKENIIKNLSIEGNYLIQKLKQNLDSKDIKTSFIEIVNTIGMLFTYFLDLNCFSSYTLLTKVSFDDNLMGRLLGVSDYLLTLKTEKFLPPQVFADDLVKTNKMGPLVFACPEIGRFSTVGGLGVMVDELSQGLVNLGEEV